MKRVISLLLSIVMFVSIWPTPAVHAAEEDTVTIENDYIRLTVSKENGGYTISTLEGDILKKSDNDKLLTHRGENFDTSFTSFKIDDNTDKTYVFGNDYGLFGMDSSSVETEVDSAGITSTWHVNDLEVSQRIELVSGVSSEQLGTALISYMVRNKSQADISVKSRVLIDTQLGDKDFGYYEVTKGILGAGYNSIDKETTLSGGAVPADYFVKDSPFEPDIAAFGVNSVISTDKPYKMTFAHWANIASTKFDYTIDPTLTFSNAFNKHRTADSAAALYFELGSIKAGGEKSFSTFYGVTANLKNKDNQVIINTTAPSKLEFDDTRTAFIGSSGKADNLIRINSTISNPALQDKTYKKLAVCVYAIGFSTQRQADDGSWIKYDNTDPLFTDIINFLPGENKTTFFDFKFKPQDNHELGSFVTKVFNMDPEVNELGVYAEEYCLGETTNYIFIPAKDPTLPSITLHGTEPAMLYNEDRRFLNVYGIGMSFFSTGLQAIELRSEHKTYAVPVENISIAQDAKSMSILLDKYMEPGRYQLHFLWDGTQPNDIPSDFTSSSLYVQMTTDESYRNDIYGIVTVQRDDNDKYKVVAYESESDFEKGDGAAGDGGYNVKDIIFVLRGGLIKDNDKDEYRIDGKDKDITINHILNYHGSDLVVSQSGGSVEVLMNGKLTTIGANTTIRNGAAAFKLESGTDYVVPVYNSGGKIQSGGSLGANQDYIELKWNNAVDTLQTIGGFLIDLKYGIMGKIQDENDSSTTYDIISFGGGLDLSFMTPGGAKTARENKTKDAGWDLSDINDRSGLNPIGGPQESEQAPTTTAVYKLQAGATVHDVLYGQNGKEAGHIGINMEANLQLPQIVSFLPSKMAGSLAINTIGGYQVGVNGETKTATFEMSFALVIKSNPSGAPIPDKLYFSLGGFEPGVNIDSAGILWVTGGGGGFDNLYDTIYGTDGIPPFKLLLNVQFDIFKIMTGQADLELSLRSFGIYLSDVSLKMMKDAKFLDGGSIAATWYPNFDLSARASVNFMQVFKGTFSLTANEELFEMMMRVALSLPQAIPIVGGMEIAAAELGGGTEKMWGSVEVMSLIEVGFIYWWDSGNVQFTSGNSESRSLRAFQMMTEPQVVGTNAQTGKTQYMAIGSNLSYISGNIPDQSLTDEYIESLKSTSDTVRKYSADSVKSAPAEYALNASTLSKSTSTTIVSNTEQDSHVVTLGAPEGDYILTVTRADGGALDSDFENHISVWNNGEVYPLNFYKKPNIIADMGEGETLSDEEKAKIKSAAAKANVNIVNDVAYIAIPYSKQANPLFLVEFNDGVPYEVGAVYVSPISKIENQSAVLDGGKLKANWTCVNMSDTATVSVSISDEPDADGIVLEKGISAKNGSAEIDIPDTVASGMYYVTITLIDEEKCFETYEAGSVQIIDAKAPTAPLDVTLANAGNNKLKLTINDNFDKEKLEGYYLDVYEDNKLIEAAVYYDKEQAKNNEVLIGGRYDMPIMEPYTEDEDTKYRQKTDANGVGMFQEIGFEPGKSYSVKVRAGSVEDTTDGDVYHYSGYVLSNAVVLEEATPPVLGITAPGAIDVGTGGVDFTLAISTNTFRLTANEPVKGTLTVNGTSGETYTFDSEWKTVWEKELTLPDGIYTLEFDAVDEAGNRSLYQTSVSIDTIVPNIMLESPVNGGVFSNQEILVKGVADSDALYTFKVDGVAVGEENRNMSRYFTDGILNYTIPLSNSVAKQHTFEIIATDAAGNIESKQMEITDSKLSDIVRVEIYNHNQPVPEYGIRLNGLAKATELQLMGITDNGQIIDITDAQNVAFMPAAGSSITISNSTLTASSEGDGMVLASLDLGGGSTLIDGVMVTVGEEVIYDAIDAALAEAKAISKGNYTDETWNALQEAIASGELLRNMHCMDQVLINNAATAIIDAIAGLLKKETESRETKDKKAYYTITFNSNGGSSMNSQRIARNGRLTNPGEPEKAGYIFTGWYIDKKLTIKYDFEKWVTSSFTLYAGWKENALRNNSFSDVNESDWFYEDVAYVYTNHLFNGTTADSFSPKMPMTRAMLVTVLQRMEGEIAGTNFENPFNDVASDAYYSTAVSWAASNGIVKGVGDGRFAPDAEITREQIAVILLRYMDYSKIAYSVNEDFVKFADEDEISDYAKNAVQILYKLGIINGIGDRIIDPKGLATRAEVAAMLHRFMEKVR